MRRLVMFVGTGRGRLADDATGPPGRGEHAPALREVPEPSPAASASTVPPPDSESQPTATQQGPIEEAT
jgi:hypothetical protein